jgi:DNA-binding MarR family transcriptional regulator
MPDEVAETARRLARGIQLFMGHESSMPLQYMNAFLLVATDEGKSVNEYAKRSGVSMSVMSRHLLDIGDRNRHMEPGMGLVTSKPCPMELRKHEITLTPKGRTLLARIIQATRI